MKKILSIFVAGALFLTSISNNSCLAVSQNSVKEKTINSSRLNSVSKKAKNCATAIGNFLKENGGIIVLTGTGASLLVATSFGGFNLAKNSKEVKEILLDSSKTYKEKLNAVLKIALFGNKEQKDKKEDQKQEDKKVEDEKQEDKKVEDEKQEDKKVEDEKQEDKKVEDEKQEDKKVEDEKQEDKKVEDEKQEDKKVEDEKQEDKKVEDEKQEDKKVEDEKQEDKNEEDEKKN